YELAEEQPQEPEQDNQPDDLKGALAQMNEIYAAVSVGGKFRVMTGLPHPQYPLQRVAEFSTKTDFLNHIVTPKITIVKDGETTKHPRGRWWFENPQRRKYDGIDFLPGAPEEIVLVDARVANRTIRKANMWSGFSVKRAEGDCSLYLTHLRENVCGNNA